MFSPKIEKLMSSLRVLPGVGPKSAQRMALYLLERNRAGAENLAGALLDAVESVRRCRSCRTLTELDVCPICSSDKRDGAMLCVVEMPADVFALEQSATYNGKYFVLLGRLSPIDGVGPKELGLDALFSRIESGSIKELIIATNPSMEGEATAHYIADRARSMSVKVTRIAHGIPIGGELEYIDSGTLAHAMTSRREL